MVVYNLICEAEHPFEGWFPSAEGYGEQAAHQQISCPVCGTTNVVKLPNAFAIHTKKEEKNEQPRRRRAPSRHLSETEAKEALLRVHHHVRENFADVGPRFAEEARKMFHGDVEKKSIYGTATVEERDELDSNGVPYAILPKPELDS
ncbi:MAG: DUF1178 family protein [Deltaproteobacteria bacterium]|nr:DUF1178 family protein [Deltaproteobacteria bacterium]